MLEDHPAVIKAIEDIVRKIADAVGLPGEYAAVEGERIRQVRDQAVKHAVAGLSAELTERIESVFRIFSASSFTRRILQPGIDREQVIEKFVQFYLGCIALQSGGNIMATHEDQPAAQPAHVEARHDQPNPADSLWKDVLEKQAATGAVNMAYVVRKYRETIGDRPLTRLLQDIEQRIGIYSNILEELKQKATSADDQSAAQIRQKFEGLGLVPASHLPNPWGSELAKHAVDKLRTYGMALLDLMARHAIDIKAELRISAKVNFKFDVSLSLSPSATLGVQTDGDD